MGLAGAFEGALARLRLRACSSVGADPSVAGAPFIRNYGTLEVGARFRLSSSPVVSHIALGRGARITIGDGVAIGYGAALFSEVGISIGDGARIGPFAVISDTDFHVVGDREARPAPRPIEIGRGVLIGARVTLLPGARLADGASVAAGSTVAGYVAAGTHVAGAPARPLSRTQQLGTSESAIAALVARTFGLAEPPPMSARPADIPGWDSLGGLRLLLALEEEIGVQIGERGLAGVERIADLVAVAGRSRGQLHSLEAQTRVPELIQKTLGLAAAPGAEAGPHSIPEWDSLGALRILLAVEDELGLRLGERAMTEVRSVGDLIDAVARAQSAGALS
jgi:acetyltransferase-like isoleucine patch superfamily enzyme/acyl carrier protein